MFCIRLPDREAPERVKEIKGEIYKTGEGIGSVCQNMSAIMFKNTGSGKDNETQ
jgi:hypothetical protein